MQTTGWSCTTHRIQTSAQHPLLHKLLAALHEVHLWVACCQLLLQPQRALPKCCPFRNKGHWHPCQPVMHVACDPYTRQRTRKHADAPGTRR